MLKNSAKEFCQSKTPVQALRKLRDERSSIGYDPKVWTEMAEMGWASLTIPEAYGGLEFGYMGLGLVLEETGRTLTASPLVSSVLLSATAIQLLGSEDQKQRFLPSIAEGMILVSMAIDEQNVHNPFHIECQANKTEHGYVLNGKKVFVLDSHMADQIIVVARTGGDNTGQDGLSMFILDAKTEGVQIDRTIMMDSRNAATIHLDNVAVSADQLLGEANQAGQALDQILDIARIGLSAEMLGLMEEAFDRTLAYLKERKQFGVIIGTFQALQHRAVKMYCEIELCKSLVSKALQAIDKQADNLAELASMTKAKVGETVELVTNEGVQLFGGIGMTDDEEIGFFMKRARVAQQTFGNRNYHLDRYAQLNGY